jgi:hypothetical protein
MFVVSFKASLWFETVRGVADFSGGVVRGGESVEETVVLPVAAVGEGVDWAA